uniref:Uncharacterized protein n=1 Tax=Ananas comosus var. bracteatus TaxID=296719 RepID=A0A6V7NSV1_ANACO|nr:unnamed protein product [Ananas comosus var. bracteatus]
MVIRILLQILRGRLVTYGGGGAAVPIASAKPSDPMVCTYHCRQMGTLLSGIAAVVGDQGLANSTSSCTGTSSEAAMFDVEYRRWLEEHHKLMLQLRAAGSTNIFQESYWPKATEDHNL